MPGEGIESIPAGTNLKNLPDIVATANIVSEQSIWKLVPHTLMHCVIDVKFVFMVIMLQVKCFM